MAKQEKSHAEGTEQISEPIASTYEEIRGITTAIHQIEAFTAHLDESVSVSASSEATALEMSAELGKLKDNPVVRAMLLISPDVEGKLKESVTKANRKAVNGSVQQIRQQMGIISELTRNLVSKYGNTAEMSPGADKKANPFGNDKKESKPDITEEILSKLNPDFISEHKLTFEPLSDTGFYRVYGTGHDKGTIYKSNLKNW